MLVLGHHDKGREYSRNKANAGNPKVNRVCPPLTATRTSADCVENIPGSSVQHNPQGVYNTGGSNAMMVLGATQWKFERNKILWWLYSSFIATMKLHHALRVKFVTLKLASWRYNHLFLTLNAAWEIKWMIPKEAFTNFLYTMHGGSTIEGMKQILCVMDICTWKFPDNLTSTSPTLWF